MTIKEQIAIADGSRFQKELAEFIAEKKFDVIVETGAGVSSLFIVNALEVGGRGGKLYSIDPSQWSSIRIESPRYELIKEKSQDALYDLFRRTGAWDFALHDSDHDIKNQTYEYEFMYACLKPGGWIASDDYTWGEHKSWENFLINHDLKAFNIGDIQIAQKPYYSHMVEDMCDYHLKCLDLAENAERMWLEKGNTNSTVQWVRV